MLFTSIVAPQGAAKSHDEEADQNYPPGDEWMPERYE